MDVGTIEDNGRWMWTLPLCRWCPSVSCRRRQLPTQIHSKTQHYLCQPGAFLFWKVWLICASACPQGKEEISTNWKWHLKTTILFQSQAYLDVYSFWAMLWASNLYCLTLRSYRFKYVRIQTWNLKLIVIAEFALSNISTVMS